MINIHFEYLNTKLARFTLFITQDSKVHKALVRSTAFTPVGSAKFADVCGKRLTIAVGLHKLAH